MIDLTRCDLKREILILLKFRQPLHFLDIGRYCENVLGTEAKEFASCIDELHSRFALKRTCRVPETYVLSDLGLYLVEQYRKGGWL